MYQIIIIDKKTPKNTRGFNSSLSASCYLMGKMLSNYICVINNPDEPAMVITFDDADVCAIEKQILSHLK